MAAPQRFDNYEQFFAFYVRQHSSRGNRMLHALGTTAGLLVATILLMKGYAWWALLGLPVAYAFAWTGHLAVEGNKPATFGHPLWSFISDFRMLALMLSGRLGRYLPEQRIGEDLGKG
jgi:hypothetical protein